MRLVKLGDDYIDPESIEAIEELASDINGDGKPRTRISLSSGATFTVKGSIDDVVMEVESDRRDDPQKLCKCGRVWDTLRDAIECAVADDLGIKRMED